jgi:hypothetical protein
MAAITQNEVRRHPRWREELKTPLSTPEYGVPSSGLLFGLTVLVLALLGVAVLVWKLKAVWTGPSLPA